MKSLIFKVVAAVSFFSLFSTAAATEEILSKIPHPASRELAQSCGCSSSSCTELGWTGCSSASCTATCANSELGPNGVCSGTTTQEAASNFCSQYGARLCTIDEVTTGEAAGTGCDYDNDLIWSCTPCTLETGGVDGCNICPRGHGNHYHVAELTVKYISGQGVSNSAVTASYSGGCSATSNYPESTTLAYDSGGGSCSGCLTSVINIPAKSNYNNGDVVTFKAQGGSYDVGNGPRFRTEAIFKVGGFSNCKINMHISCSDALLVGDRIGPFEVVAGKQPGAEACPIQESTDSGFMAAVGSPFYWDGGNDPALYTQCLAKDVSDRVNVRCCADDQQDYECFPENEPKPCSVSSCTELGWDGQVNNGIAATCAESNMGTGDTCSGTKNQKNAKNFCESYGARLCTINEVTTGEAAGTGCDYDDDLIWSSTPCTSVNNGFMVAVGSPSYWETENDPALWTQCLAKDVFDRVSVRCCADGHQDYECFPDHVPVPQPTKHPIPAPTKHPFPQPTRKPIPAPTKHPFPQPTRKPIPAPTKSPVPEPTSKPIPAPTKIPVPEPTSKPIPAPTKSPVPEPTSKPIPAPTKSPTPGVTGTPVPEPTRTPIPAPTKIPVPEPTSEPIPAPTKSPVPEPTSKPIPAPTKSPVPEPTSKPIPAPTKSPVPEPTSKPIPAPTKSPTPGETGTSTCASFAVFGIADIYSHTDLANNEWTDDGCQYLNYGSPPATDPNFLNFHKSGTGDCTLAKQLTSGYDFVRVRYGCVWSSGTTDVVVGNTVVGTADCNTDGVSNDVTVDAPYADGDFLEVIERHHGVGNIWSVDLCNLGGTPVPEPTLKPIPAPTKSPVPEPTSKPIPAPTKSPVPEPTSKPIPAPTKSPVPEPTSKPIPAPTKSPVPEPTSKPIFAPTKSPVPEPTSKPIPAPTKIPVPEPTSKPIPAPTKSPVPAPTKQPTPNNGACFHGNGTVLLQSGLSKRLSELSIGDVLKTADAQGGFSFSRVVKLPHAINDEPAAFITLQTETGKKVDMTSDHFIPKCDLKVVTAGELEVGDCLLTADGKETLVEISSTEKSGVYTAVTEDKFIVVDDVVASSFSKDSHPEEPEFDYEKYRLELERMRQRKLAYFSRKATNPKEKK